MNSQKFSPLSIFVGIADVVKVNFEGVRKCCLVNDGGRKGSASPFLSISIVCLFIVEEKTRSEKGEE
jgi:hypothetical protein